MILIASGHHPPVDVQDQVLCDPSIGWQGTQPSVGGIGRPQLPLGVRQVGTCGKVGSKGFFLLALGELGALDAGSAGSFQPQLFLVDLFDPLRQIRHSIQNAGGSLSLNQQLENGLGVVVYPQRRYCVAADGYGGHLQLISDSFLIHFV